jgi:GT2 family glycosyltransferase
MSDTHTGVRGPRICAAIVTHNRRELLTECLDAVLGQSRSVERVFVVDNASTDGTPEVLAERGYLERGVVHERLPRNAGGAGGFSRAVELAREEPCDWIWLMDDDAEPARESLEFLLRSPAAADPSTAALCSKVVDPSGAVQPLHRGFLDGRPRALPAERYAEEAPSLGYATFVGLLVRTEVAHREPPPRAEFFLWADDYEYSHRLRRHGEIRLVPASTIVHKEVGQDFQNRRGRFWNRVLGWEVSSSRYEAAWKNYLGIRNYVWMRRVHEGQGSFGFAATVAQFVLKALMYDERPLRRVPWLVRYALRGRRGDFEHLPPEEWVARARGHGTAPPRSGS